MLVLLLQKSGYEVVCPVDGKHTLELAKGQAFDLFLFDNWMPELSGIDLTIEVRQSNKTTPILFCSGAAGEDEKRSALEAGAQGYLVKPVGIEELIEEVDRLIADSKATTGVTTS